MLLIRLTRSAATVFYLQRGPAVLMKNQKIRKALNICGIIFQHDAPREGGTQFFDQLMLISGFSQH